MGDVDESLKGVLADLQRGREALVHQQHLHGFGGGGTSGGVTDDWKASVDGQLQRLHSDVRALLYGLIGGILFVIASGATAYVSLAGQVTDLRKDLSSQIADGRKDIATVQVEQAKISGKLDLLLERTAPKTPSR